MTEAVKPDVEQDVLNATAPNEKTSEAVPDQVQAPNYWKPAAVAVLISGLISSTSLAAYHMLFRSSGSLATVDLAEIVKIREIQFTNLVNRPNATDKERVEAWNLVNRIGPEIEQALEALQQDCECTLVVKSAVVAGPHEDMTEALKERLGMTGLSSKAMMESAARAVMPPASPAPAQPSYAGQRGSN